jgi:hypothetical protein
MIWAFEFNMMSVYMLCNCVDKKIDKYLFISTLFILNQNMLKIILS